MPLSRSHLRRDLISYTIAELNPLRLDECVSSSGLLSTIVRSSDVQLTLTRVRGGLCGSVYLDERFEKYIRRVLGDEVIDSMKVLRVCFPSFVSVNRLSSHVRGAR